MDWERASVPEWGWVWALQMASVLALARVWEMALVWELDWVSEWEQVPEQEPGWVPGLVPEWDLGVERRTTWLWSQRLRSPLDWQSGSMAQPKQSCGSCWAQRSHRSLPLAQELGLVQAHLTLLLHTCSRHP